MKVLKNNFLIILLIFVIFSCFFYLFIDNKTIEGIDSNNKSKSAQLLKEVVNAQNNIVTQNEINSGVEKSFSQLINEKKDSINDYLKLYKEYLYLGISYSNDNPDGFIDKEKVKEELIKKDSNKMSYKKFNKAIKLIIPMIYTKAIIMEVLGIDTNNSSSTTITNLDSAKTKLDSTTTNFMNTFTKLS